MKRDYNLMRLILLQVRDEQPPDELRRYEEAAVVYNSALLVKDNYIEGQVIEDGTGNPASVVLLHLTNKGHDLLEKLEAPVQTSEQTTTAMSGPHEFPVNVFISHSAKDEKLAGALVELLRSALNIPANSIRCTSINGYRLPAGAPTDEQVRREVHESKAFIGLITPSSMASAYVMFELGARWGAGLHLVPLLGAGADASYLRGPLSALNALNCGDAAQVHQLIDDLAGLLGISEPTPTAAYQVYVDKLILASKTSTVASPRSPPKPEIDSQLAGEQLSQEELMVMKLFTNTPREGLLAARIVEQVKMHPLKVSQLLDQLVKRDLLYEAVRMGMPAYYRLKSKGRDYIISQGLI
jgi:DNA-binding MarR family transcriptional regulator